MRSSENNKRLAILTRAIIGIPTLGALLDEYLLVKNNWRSAVNLSGVIAWGYKPSATHAERFAKEHGLTLYRIEDGFLRSVELGNIDPPLSIVIDDIAIYYDGSKPSRLETLIKQSLTTQQKKHTESLIYSWKQSRVSKYNHLREYHGCLPEHYTLIPDQTFGDASIAHGRANQECFQQMLKTSLEENPACTAIIKVHPDVFAGKKRGHFDIAAVSQNPRVMVLAEDAHPVSLIENAEAVYTVSSQIGFEALLWGKRVRTFGMPFYAGWGLTDDELPAPDRRGRASLEQLVHAALIEYPRYIDPESNTRCKAEQVLSHLALQRRMRERFAPVIYALGFSRWKRTFAHAFLWGSEIRFISKSSQVPKDGTLAVWGSKPVKEQLRTGVEILHIEDGFLRSVGLGADLIRPLSWVIDRQGIYYDATRPSDLEELLRTTDFTTKIIERAHSLRERIVAEGITKYNVGTSSWSRPRKEKRVVLVPGQVERDASIHYGTTDIRTNLDLLREVRAHNPDAWVIYKPHPDVKAGLRKPGDSEVKTAEWCDEVIADVPMQILFDEVDEVHTLTSLTGFEALLRGKPVVTYGQPLYAGWGLTRDMSLSPEVAQRRDRHILLDELVAATLILYPTYVSRTTGRFTTPERALDELLDWRKHGAERAPLWRKALRMVLQAIKING